MKTLLTTLFRLLTLAATSWHFLNQPAHAASQPNRSPDPSPAIKLLEARVERLEATVAKLQRELQPRVIPVAQQ